MEYSIGHTESLLVGEPLTSRVQFQNARKIISRKFRFEGDLLRSPLQSRSPFKNPEVFLPLFRVFFPTR